MTKIPFYRQNPLIPTKIHSETINHIQAHMNTYNKKNLAKIGLLQTGHLAQTQVEPLTINTSVPHSEFVVQN